MIETGLLTIYPSFNLGAQWEPAQSKPTDQPWIVYATIDNGRHATARLIQPWTDELSEVGKVSMNERNHIEPMTLRERFGCLALALLMVAIWGVLLSGMFELGRWYPHKVATDLQPCVVQSGFVSIQP